MQIDIIFFGGLNKSNHQDCEDSDRSALGLPYAQDRVISDLAKVNKNLIFVNISGNAVAMPWVNEVPRHCSRLVLGFGSRNGSCFGIGRRRQSFGEITFHFSGKVGRCRCS